jgi:hypothetical protein
MEMNHYRHVFQMTANDDSASVIQFDCGHINLRNRYPWYSIDNISLREIDTPEAADGNLLPLIPSAIYHWGGSSGYPVECYNYSSLSGPDANGSTVEISLQRPVYVNRITAYRRWITTGGGSFRISIWVVGPNNGASTLVYNNQNPYTGGNIDVSFSPILGSKIRIQIQDPGVTSFAVTGVYGSRCFLPMIGVPNIASDGVVVYHGIDNKIHRLVWAAENNWSDWSMGYSISGNPCQTTSGIIWYRGTDNCLHRAAWSQSTGFVDWNMGYPMNGDPVATSAGMVWFRGADNKLHRLSWAQGSGWTDWNMGYPIGGNPYAVSDGLVYYRGADNNMHRLAWAQSTGFSDWNMGYPMSGDPHVKVEGLVWYRGADGNLHKMEWTQSTGYVDMNMGYPMNGAPCGSSATVVWFRGSDNKLHRLARSSSTATTWSDWNMGYAMNGDPNAVSDGEVWFRGGDNNLHKLWWTPAAWMYW